MYGAVQSPPGSPFEVVVIVGSLGAVQLHDVILTALPADLPAAVVVVQHRSPTSHDRFAELLGRNSPMPVEVLGPHGRLAAGRVYVAPADHRTEVVAPFETRSAPLAASVHPRPPADPVLQTAAAHHGERVLAVVLSGRLADGAVGARAVKLAGGHLLVQHPDTAQATGMPQAALATGCADLCLAPERLGGAIAVLCGVPGAAALFRGRTTSWAQSVGAGLPR